MEEVFVIYQIISTQSCASIFIESDSILIEKCDSWRKDGIVVLNIYTTATSTVVVVNFKVYVIR